MDNVKIRGYKNGIMIWISPDAIIDEVYVELKEKLDNSRKMLGEATVAVKIDGRELIDLEIERIYNIISAHTKLKVACIYNDSESVNKSFEDRIASLEIQEKISSLLKKKEQIISENKKELMEEQNNKVVFEKLTVSNENKNDENNNKLLFSVYKSSLTDGNLIQSSKNIIIIGDVQKGSTVVSDHDIYIYGSLFGEAYAGAHSKTSCGNPDATITALHFEPEDIKIDNVSLISKRNYSKKNKIDPKICYLSNKGITVDNLELDFSSKK